MTSTKQSSALRPSRLKSAHKIDWHRFDSLTNCQITKVVAADSDAAPILTPA